MFNDVIAYTAHLLKSDITVVSQAYIIITIKIVFVEMNTLNNYITKSSLQCFEQPPNGYYQLPRDIIIIFIIVCDRCIDFDNDIKSGRCQGKPCILYVVVVSNNHNWWWRAGRRW